MGDRDNVAERRNETYGMHPDDDPEELPPGWGAASNSGNHQEAQAEAISRNDTTEAEDDPNL